MCEKCSDWVTSRDGAMLQGGPNQGAGVREFFLLWDSLTERQGTMVFSRKHRLLVSVLSLPHPYRR